MIALNTDGSLITSLPIWGYEDGDLLAYGLLVKATIPKNIMLADLTNIKKIIKPKEKEFIVKPIKRLEVELLDVQEYKLNYKDAKDAKTLIK